MKLERILIANRGEIARRIIRTCHRLGIESVAVYSEPDSGALHVKEATRAFRLSSRSRKSPYLDIEAIIRTAKESGANGIHPGYGFLSESKEFAEAVAVAGLCFIGPSPRTLELLGEKDKARSLADQLGIPIAKGFLVEAAQPQTGQQLASLEYPVLIKAVSGGGGRGMRVANNAEELLPLLESARREAEQFFGSGAIIVEEFISPARHVEIQLLGDTAGTVLHLFERDCSTQRRNQKIIEESPARNVPQALLEKLYAAAVSLGKAGTLTGVATAEFLLRLDGLGNPTGQYYFLEVNPRIQVEHPVTEMVTGVDLVEQQILAAEGKPLAFSQEAIKRSGHAIQARVYAEIPELDFIPSSGELKGLRIPEPKPCMLRPEHALLPGSIVDTEFDPMLLKLISWGKDFAAARDLLRQALTETDLSGVPNNLRFLGIMLGESHFSQASIPVDFFNRISPAAVSHEEPLLALMSALAIEACDGISRFSDAAFLRPHGSSIRRGVSLPARTWHVRSSHCRSPSELMARVLAVELVEDGVHLYFEAEESQFEIRCIRRGSRYLLSSGERVFDCIFRQMPSPLGSEERRLTLLQQEWQIFPRRAALRDLQNDGTGAVQSPFPGTVIRILHSEGEEVSLGQPLFVLESMKMEHYLPAPAGGTLSDCRVREGARVQAGDLLCRIV